MCGGDEKPFKESNSILSNYGKNIHLNGGAGKGQHTKMVNQIVLAGNMIGVV
jgi:3-hydroxyisobutyrate dehydrogenase